MPNLKKILNKKSQASAFVQDTQLAHEMKITKGGAVHAKAFVQVHDLDKCRLDKDGTLYAQAFQQTRYIGEQLEADDKIVQIDAGSRISIALSEKGRVFTWGGTEYKGVLGNGQVSRYPTYRAVPIEITNNGDFPDDWGDDKIIQVAISAHHGAALSDDGRLFTWGAEYQGTLGNAKSGEDDYQPFPEEITNSGAFPNDWGSDKLVQVSLGFRTSCALSDDGRLFTWGGSGFGMLGSSDPEPYVTTPIEITNSGDFPDNWGSDKLVQAVANNYHMSALAESGRLFMWGAAGHGRLGNDSTTPNVMIPEEITNNGDFPNDWATDKIIHISLGAEHSAAVSQDGRVFIWGSDEYGQIGKGANTDDQLTPLEITNSGDFPNDWGTDKLVSASLGSYMSFAVSEDGRMFTWGRALVGLLGNGTTSPDITLPAEITNNGDFPDVWGDDKIVRGSFDWGHGFAVSQDGRCFAWGQCAHGRLGNLIRTGNETTPIEITI